MFFGCKQQKQALTTLSKKKKKKELIQRIQLYNFEP